MRTRNDNSIFEDLIEISSRIPIWVSLLLAVVSYLVIHQFADVSQNSITYNEAGRLEGVFSQLIKSIAVFLQYVIPAAFLFGILIRMVKKVKKKQMP
jgi:restriction system protein